MGINRAADKVKWAAIHFIETLPQVQRTLSVVESAMNNGGTTAEKWTQAGIHVDETLSHVERTLAGLDVAVHDVRLAAASIREAAVAFMVALFFVSLTAMIYCYRKREIQPTGAQSNQVYLRLHYGDDVEMICRSYVSLAIYHAYRPLGFEPEDRKVVFIGANESVKSRIRRELNSGFLLDYEQLFFKTVTEALRALDNYCKPSSDTSIPKRAKTAFILLLISSQDPAVFGPHLHESFKVPSSLEDHHVVIIGTGFHQVPAHKLSRSSVGSNGKPLEQCLLVGAEEAGFGFY